MGCNTSKESVQPAAEDAKDDVKNGDIPKTTVSGESTAEAGSPAEGSSPPTSGQKQQQQKPEEGEKGETEESAEDKDKEDEAATRIQAAFRGHHARKSMKETEGSAQQKGTKQEEDREPTQEELQEEFRADDKELCNAATKIQASFRGHMSRKEQAGGSVGKAVGEFVDNAAAKIEEKGRQGVSQLGEKLLTNSTLLMMDDALNELDGIDLTDPDLHKAATKIQASFRGHKVRQEVVVAPGTEDKK